MPWFLSKVIIRFIFNQISPSLPICVNLRHLRIPSEFTKSHRFRESRANTVSSITNVMCGIEATLSLSRAFSAHYEAVNIPGALPQARNGAAALPLNRYSALAETQRKILLSPGKAVPSSEGCRARTRAAKPAS
jgi:hypothetical protein